MAQEANLTLSDPTASAPEMDHSQEDSRPEAADTAIDEGTSEPHKEGADEEESAESTIIAEQPNVELRLTKLSSC